MLLTTQLAAELSRLLKKH